MSRDFAHPRAADYQICGRATRHGHVAVAMLCALFLSACSFRDSIDAGAPDTSITTSSVSYAPAMQPDADRLSDEATIRNAVSSANVDTMLGMPLSWANAETGSEGVILDIAQRDLGGGVVCRSFRATITSYAGARMTKGEICLVGPGEWRTRSFETVAS